MTLTGGKAPERSVGKMQRERPLSVWVAPEPRINRPILKGTKDALMHASQRLTSHQALERFQPETELSRHE